MFRLAADENFNFHLVRGLLRRNPTLDLVTVQDAGLSGASDPEVLEWAAREGRVLLTHDLATMNRHAYGRITRGESMPGLIQASRQVALSQAIDDILLLCECCRDSELEGRVTYLPLR
jgi:hypothetical protein